MTKDQMSRIIEQALNTYNWADYRVTTLPAYIANAIAIKQAEPILDEEGRYLGDAVSDHDDNPTIIALRAEIERLRSANRMQLDNLDKLRNDLERLKNSIDFLRREEKASAENVSYLKDKVDDLKAKLEDAESKLKEAHAERDHFKEIANDAADKRMTALQHWKARAEKAEQKLASVRVRLDAVIADSAI
jgi:DNA repair exonuclease SbcCD ATPase subunit